MKALHNLGFTEENGLVFCDDFSNTKNNIEYLYLMECQKLPVKPKAVFFRRFYKDIENIETHYHSEPVICIFQTKNNFFNSEEHIKLHAALWSAGKSEVYVIQSDSRIDIINARRPAKRVKKNLTLDDENLRLVSKALTQFNDQRFAAHLFKSGTFWEQDKFKDKIDEGSTPYYFLEKYLMEVRKDFFKNPQIVLPPTTIDKLLVISILVKFLEEIKDDDGKHTLKEIYKIHHIESEEYSEAIKKKVHLKILDKLADEFNGKIFNQFDEQEKKDILKADLNILAQFLRADVDLATKQGFLWKQYSFNHLPTELISTIYENFIGTNEKGVVYTPIPLVNMLVDEVMPLDDAKLFKGEQFTILDPACGSGAFLVAAYKRLLQWWMINNNNNTDKNIIYPNSEVVKKILEGNIFGVDIEETAVLVSIFSLTIALLDKLSPKEIWNKLQFSDLQRRNIKKGNFSDWAFIAKESQQKFDLVIGNPPFNPSSKGDIPNEDVKELFEQKVPGNKLALKFLEGALFFGKKICMIIPSSVFLYNKAKTNQIYRNRIFTNYTVEKIIDFTYLREKLFKRKESKKGRTPVLSLIVNNQLSKYSTIEHIIVKQTLLSEKKLGFEIDYYDYHQVPWQWAVDDEKHFIWKVNLLGGGRLFHLIYRLSLLRTLKEFFKEKKKENENWLWIRGFEGGKQLKLDNQDQIIDISNNQATIDYNITIESSKFKNKLLYAAPFLVIDYTLGIKNIPIVFIRKYFKKYLYFNRDFLGISAPKQAEQVLNNIFKAIKTDFASLYQLSALVNSGSYLILRDTEINQEDIEQLPYPHNLTYLELSKAEKLLQDDVLKYYIHLGKSMNGKAKELYKKITTNELRQFGAIFCSELNDIYAKNGKSWQIGEITQTPMFTIYQLGFGKDGGLNMLYNHQEIIDDDIQTLINNKTANESVLFKRIIRLYNHVNGYDCVFFIKPNARRYWLPSIALRDADDTFMDLRKAGY